MSHRTKSDGADLKAWQERVDHARMNLLTAARMYGGTALMLPESKVIRKAVGALEGAAMVFSQVLREVHAEVSRESRKRKEGDAG